MANVLVKVPQFFREVKIELTKVSWPTKKDLLGATRVVMVITLLMVIYIGSLDFVLSKIISWFLR